MPSATLVQLSTTSDIVDTVSNLDTDAVTTVVELIDNYGAVVVVLGLFLVLFAAMIYYMISHNNKLVDQIMQSQKSAEETNTELVKSLLLQHVEKNAAAAKVAAHEAVEEENEKQRNHQKTAIASYIDANLAFKDASRIAMNKTGCQRIAIYLFHNGNTTPYGYHFAKMTCVHEWTRNSVATVRGQNQVDIPLFAFSNMIDSLAHKDYYYRTDIYGKPNEDEQILKFIAGSDAVAMYAQAVKSREDDNIAAFIVAEFNEVGILTEDNKDQMKDALSTMADNIYSIIINTEFRTSYSGRTN